MPLEFALRPRFDLNRPVRRRRVTPSRFARFAVPTAAYWLAIAGATHAFLKSTRTASAGGAHDTTSTARTASFFDSPLPNVTVAEDAPRPPPATAAAHPAREPSPEPAAAPTLGPTPAPTAVSPPEPNVQRPPLLPNDTPRANTPHDADRTDGHDDARNAARAALLPSCESASATGNQTVSIGAAPGAPDLTREAFASVLEDGTYLNRCAIPARTALDICAAVQNGKVVGLTVTSEPRSPTINACVRRAVTSLRFPKNERLDITRTRFAPTR